MIYGPVRTSRIAYRKRGKENLYPQDRQLNWAVAHSFSAGVVKRVAKAVAAAPFEQAAAQVSAQGAITLGKRQGRGVGDRGGDRLRGVLHRAAAGSQPGRDRVASHRGRVGVPRPARGVAAGDRQGRGRPGAGRRGQRLAR
jgi:hypothetical protein